MALYLLDHGAAADMVTAHGFTVAHMAANRGNVAVLARVLEAAPALANAVRHRWHSILGNASYLFVIPSPAPF
jgi:ankyrin repeat protein